MARFPRTEAEIVALAQDIIGGLTANSATYPAPPTAPLDLQALLDSFVTLSDDAVAARAVSEQATATKEAGLEEMTNAMQSVLRYAENTVDFDDDQLKLLGWGGRRARTPLELPGQPRTLCGQPVVGEAWAWSEVRRHDVCIRAAIVELERLPW